MKNTSLLHRGWTMTAGFALLCLSVAPLRTFSQDAGRPPLILHVGLTRSSSRNVNASDATAAFRIFARTVARKHGYQLDTDAQLFDSPAACEAEIKKGAINMAVLDTWDYLGMNLQGLMEPGSVHQEPDTVFKDYLLPTQRGSGLSTLADLRDKDLTVLEGKGGNLSRAWLDSLLVASHLGSKETLFQNPAAPPGSQTGSQP